MSHIQKEIYFAVHTYIHTYIHTMMYFCVYYCVGDKIVKIEIGGTCGTYGGRERCAQGFGGET